MGVANIEDGPAVDLPPERVAEPSRRDLLARARNGHVLDVSISWLLMLAAVGCVLLVGIHHALDQPVYGPIDEAYHAGYVQRMADTGVPPMQGRDQIMLAHRPIREGEPVLPGPRAGTAP